MKNRFYLVLLVLVTALFIYRHSLSLVASFCQPKFVDDKAKAFVKPVILLWTTYFAINMSHSFLHRAAQCSYDCFVTDNRRMLSYANAIVYHLRDMKLWDLPNVRYSNQLYVFYNQESPPNSGSALQCFIPNNFFNLTMTYRTDSDVYAGYGIMEPIESSGSVEKYHEIVLAALGKQKSVLYIASNCRTHSAREAYVDELSKYIEVTRLGGCARKKCDSQCDEDAVANHHFYLAFENSVCRDYVTEKLYKRMAQHLIPVVLKDSTYRNLLPERSYIAANQFSSPSALAIYLKHLEEHPNELLKYVAWTTKYRIRTDVNSICGLCKYLHLYFNSSEFRTIPDIQQWWIRDAECIQNYAKSLLQPKQSLFK